MILRNLELKNSFFFYTKSPTHALCHSSQNSTIEFIILPSPLSKIFATPRPPAFVNKDPLFWPPPSCLLFLLKAQTICYSHTRFRTFEILVNCRDRKWLLTLLFLKNFSTWNWILLDTRNRWFQRKTRRIIVIEMWDKIVSLSSWVKRHDNRILWL